MQMTEKSELLRLPPSLSIQLEALECPYALSLDGKEFSQVILWLEEAVIRFYSKQKRQDLMHKVDDGWWKRILTYAEEVGARTDECETDNTSSKFKLLMRLSKVAVNLQYEDDIKDMKFGNVKNNENYSVNRNGIESEIEDTGLNYIQEVLNKYLTALGLPELPSNPKSKEIEAAAEVLASRVAGINDFVTSGNQHQEENKQLQHFLPSKGEPHGSFVDNYRFAMRAQQLGYLQSIQHNVNEQLEELQLLTADPKTDFSLGRVGV